MNHRIESAIATCVVMCMFSCGMAHSPSASPPKPHVEDCSGAVPTYSGVVRPTIDRYCTKCHSPNGTAGEDHDFTQYELLHAQRRQLTGQLESSAMPPRGEAKPTDEERAALVHWATCGAPHN